MKTHRSSSSLPVWIAVLLTCIPGTTGLALPVVGRTDTFEDGTTQGWGGSYPGYTPLPMNVAGGGPAGPNDHFMQISTNRFHLATHNQTRAWTGDYLAVGVRAISMDLIHLSGNVDVHLRLAVFGPGGMFATVERTPSLREQAGWTRHTFGLTARDLVYVTGGTGRLEDTLSQVTKVLIRHDRPVPSAPGRHPPHLTASVGIDNITAVLRDYDVAWTFGSEGTAAYRLDLIEPAHAPLGEIGAGNPSLFLEMGKRYQVTVDPNAHPLEIIAKGPSASDDEVVLSMLPAVTGPFENDEGVEWYDPGDGTVAFTLTEALWTGLQGDANQSPGYRCAIHPETMRGDLTQ